TSIYVIPAESRGDCGRLRRPQKIKLSANLLSARHGGRRGYGGRILGPMLVYKMYKNHTTVTKDIHEERR
ncbi:MAG: hypothetical protein HY397_03130, partial [Candidatus Doudnabacteria bacterium]|nr:hypothetical protein [Candidatus Doudnabacteria bacterium]